ncbi:MAG: hypothetical protein MJE68_28370, partial [Proteobacteria bacterium]|nr:hypothetical protein [Pseudomonadota bacterium]
DRYWRPEGTDLPPVIPPSGLSLERQQYLFEKIREFCREGTKDLVCPNPSADTTTTITPKGSTKCRGGTCSKEEKKMTAPHLSIPTTGFF